jgi:hypothetical protein
MNDRLPNWIIYIFYLLGEDFLRLKRLTVEARKLSVVLPSELIIKLDAIRSELRCLPHYFVRYDDPVPGMVFFNRS